MVLLHIIHSLLSLKFRSTLANIAKIYINTSFFIKYVFFWDAVFAEKNPGGRAEGLAKWVGAIQSPSVA